MTAPESADKHSTLADDLTTEALLMQSAEVDPKVRKLLNRAAELMLTAAADLTLAERSIVRPESRTINAAGPAPISEVSVPLTEAISTPCKGCGKRPIDFMEGPVNAAPQGNSLPSSAAQSGLRPRSGTVPPEVAAPYAPAATAEGPCACLDGQHCRGFPNCRYRLCAGEPAEGPTPRTIAFMRPFLLTQWADDEFTEKLYEHAYQLERELAEVTELHRVSVARNMALMMDRLEAPVSATRRGSDG